MHLAMVLHQLACPLLRNLAGSFMTQQELPLGNCLVPAGVSTRLYEEFLKPLLLVALFAPPEELSAGAVLGAFYFYSA